MTSELAYEASDEASENELLDRSLSVWRGWSAIEWEDFTPIALDIHTACSIGQYDWVRSLIARNDGLAIDRKNHGGWTPLMYACYIGHDNIVNLLVNASCQMNLKNPCGHTPLILAASCGNESVARTLIRNGAELELTDKCGRTALFHATYAGHQNFVAYLLETGANMDAVEPVTGMTPFMEAAAEGHEIIVQLFLQHGVNVNAKAYNGDMARSLALINGYMKIVSLIDNHVLPLSSLRSEPGLDFYLSSSDDSQPRPRSSNVRSGRGKSKGPSIRDGPEAIARMIDRTRNTDMSHYTSPALPKGYVSFSGAGDMKSAGTQLSHRDVTSPINPDDYKDNSGTTDFDDYNDESNAFTKTGAITIKSSSSSSGGLMAALGLSREGSIDSDDSPSVELSNSLSDHHNFGNAGDDEDGAKTSPQQSAVPSSGPDRELQAGASGLAPKQDADLPSVTVSADDAADAGKEKEKPWAVVSPLKDYFPVEIPFHVNYTNVPPQNSQQVVLTASPLSQEPNPVQSLPADNMTQAEIVSRYLDNLNLGTGSRQAESSEENGNKEVSRPSVSTQLHGDHGPLFTSHQVSATQNMQQGMSSNRNLDTQNGNLLTSVSESLVPMSFVHGSGQITQNPKQSSRTTQMSAAHDLVQDPSARQPINFVPCNPVSPALLDTKNSLQPLPPYIHQHQLPSSYLPPSAHHHHHHHHHFHSSHQTSKLPSTYSPSSMGDHPQHHYQIGHENFMPGMPGFYNLQQHRADSQSFLQTVPPELYYRDVDSSPQIHPGNVEQVLEVNPASTGRNQPHAGISIQHSPNSLGNPTKDSMHLQSHNDSNAGHRFPPGRAIPAKSKNSNDPSQLVQPPSMIQDWPGGPQNPISNTHQRTSSLQATGTESIFSSNALQSKLTTRCDDTQCNTNLFPENFSASQSKKENASPSQLPQVGGYDRVSFATRPMTSTKTSTESPTTTQGQKNTTATSQPQSFANMEQNKKKGSDNSSPKTPSSASENTSIPARVMIPGHATSQPISQSISWLSDSNRVGGGPKDLREMLSQLGLTKYFDKFDEQDVDLPVFLSLTDNDLKELGIKLFGPRKKMTNAIARWHSNAPLSCSELEQAYADRLEGEMQEMAIQLNQAVANEESLKAQVLQEQQLRSVTEGCLMEMRMSWCQARQLIQDSHGAMRTVGDLLTRLRHNQKDLKKAIVNRAKEGNMTAGGVNRISHKTQDSFVGKYEQNEMARDTITEASSARGSFERSSTDDRDVVLDDQGDKDTSPNCSISESNAAKVARERKPISSELDSLSLEIVKKSEKSIKDMQQALAGLIHNMDHILKSTQNMNTIEKDMT